MSVVDRERWEAIVNQGLEARWLLEQVLMIRMYGEHAPGGSENWKELDIKIEKFLRGLPFDKAYTPNNQDYYPR